RVSPSSLWSKLSAALPLPTGLLSCPAVFFSFKFSSRPHPRKFAPISGDEGRCWLYFVRDPWPWGKPHEAARVHHAREHCGGVAARGARAAASEAADHRIPRHKYTFVSERMD